METLDQPSTAGASSQRLVRLIQCGRASCGYVLTEDEQKWVPHPEFENSTTGTCPKCGKDSFYHLNAQGQKRRMSEPLPWEIDPNDIEPSPKMGLKMKRRILAAKRRAIEANAKLSDTAMSDLKFQVGHVAWSPDYKSTPRLPGRVASPAPCSAWLEAPTEDGWWWRYVTGSSQPMECLHLSPVTVAGIKENPLPWVKFSKAVIPSLPNAEPSNQGSENEA